MQKFILTLVSVVVICFQSFGQTGTIRGTVYDRDSGEPIIYANVFLENTTIGTTSDINGFYNISDVEPGEYVLMTTYLGYDTARIEIKVRKNGIVNETLYLSQSGIQMGVVNISARKEEQRTEVKISQVSVTPKQIKALPSVGGEPDIVQYLQVIPGVISTGDQGGQIYIRGGSPVQNKILLDGLNIYNPFHSVGFFSVFETDLIRNVDVLTGGFGAEHGGRVSAIVDIRTREGNKVEHGGYVSGSPFVAKMMLEGPIKKFGEGEGSTSFVFSGKKSLIEHTSKNLYAYAAENDSIGLPFSFQDFYGKMSVQSSSGSKLDVFGFNFQDQFNDPTLANIGWDNTGVGANFNLVPASSDIILSGAVGYSNYNLEFLESTEGPRTSSIREIGANLDFVFFGNQNEFSYGVDLRSIRTDFSFTNPFRQTLDQAQSTTELSGYGKYRQIIGNLVIEPSFRAIYYASQNTFSAEPRFGLKYNFSDRLRFKAAGGLYSQNILSTNNDRDVVNLFNGFLSGPTSQVRALDGGFLDNKIQTARHLIAGFEVDITENLEINIEGYFKDFPRIITINRNKLTPEEPNYIQEEGEAYGIDFSARYEKGSMYVWATYSYGFVNRFDGEQKYPTNFDRRHNANLLISYYLDEASTWQMSARWNFGTGFPFTRTQGFYNNLPFTSVGEDYTTSNPDQLGILFSEDRNDGRLPYYHRLDFSITKSISFSKNMGLDIVASVTNAYDRENIFYFDRVRYDRVDQLPIIPSMSMKFTF